MGVRFRLASSDPHRRVDRRAFAVDFHAEVVRCQPAHRLVRVVEDADVDEDARDVDAFRVPGRLLCGRGGGQHAGCECGYGHDADPVEGHEAILAPVAARSSGGGADSELTRS